MYLGFHCFALLGGSGISIPIPRDYCALRDEMLKGVESGKYVLGDLIHPKSFEKLVINKNGEVKKTLYTVSGRKIPFSTIRKKIYDEHKKLDIMRESSGDITRYLLLWADHASTGC